MLLKRIDKPLWYKVVHSWLLKKLFLTQEDLYQALGYAKDYNILSHSSWTLINSVMQIANMQVRDVMTPKTKVVSIDVKMPLSEILKIMSDSAYSRFPAFDDEQLQGILLAKDIFNHFINHPDNDVNIADYLRPHITVPESKPLESLLKQFQGNKNHMALVVDEYRNISGLLTIEDVVEQIVGEIEDEHDFEEDNIIDYGQGRYLVRAITTLEEFNSFFKCQLIGKNSQTISGLVLSGFERMPSQLEDIDLVGFNFKVLKSNDRRLHLLEVCKLKPKTKPKQKPN